MLTSYSALLHDAYTEALKSPDPSTQNGAVILPVDTRVLVFGHNRPTKGLALTPGITRDGRLTITEHAERSAIYAAARLGIATEGALMVCPWSACVECARAIVEAGIVTLVRHAKVMARTPERWTESIALADSILTAGGVEIVLWHGHIGALPIRHNGEEFQP